MPNENFEEGDHINTPEEKRVTPEKNGGTDERIVLTESLLAKNAEKQRKAEEGIKNCEKLMAALLKERGLLIGQVNQLEARKTNGERLTAGERETIEMLNKKIVDFRKQSQDEAGYKNDLENALERLQKQETEDRERLQWFLKNPLPLQK